MNQLIMSWSLAVVLCCLTATFSLAAAGKPVQIIALGDSLTAGYGIGIHKSFPSRLQEMFRAEGIPVRVINAGVSGDTTAGGRSRLDWVLGGNPGAKAAILALGANDMLQGRSPEQAEANLEAMIKRFQARGVKVLLCGMLASRSLGEDYKKRFDAIYPRLAKKHDLMLYPFLLEGVAGDPGMNQGDGIHPSAAGAELMAKKLYPMVKELVRPFMTNP